MTYAQGLRAAGGVAKKAAKKGGGGFSGKKEMRSSSTFDIGDGIRFRFPACSSRAMPPIVVPVLQSLENCVENS